MKDLEEFKKRFETAQNDEDEQMEFVWEIMASPYTEYYYSLATDKNISKEFRFDLWSRFAGQRENDAEFLLSKLDNNEDREFHPDILFCLGKLADGQKIEKERTLAYARKFADADDDRLRDRAIIVLGWIGSEKEIPLLGWHLLNDTNDKYRVWSATAFMQMYFRRKSQSLAGKALPYLKQAIRQETDYSALGDMINVVQKLTGKNSVGIFFGIGIKKGFADIIEINEEYDDDIPKKSLLIGTDVGSGFILLVADGENDGIWYYDHTYFFDKSNDELNTYVICETFSDFLKMLETTVPAGED
jgi:hypothetical protein